MLGSHRAASIPFVGNVVGNRVATMAVPSESADGFRGVRMAPNAQRMRREVRPESLSQQDRPAPPMLPGVPL